MMDKKFQSRKFLIVLWASILITIIAIMALILNRDSAWLLGLLTVLASIPAFYVGIRSAKQSGGE